MFLKNGFRDSGLIWLMIYLFIDISKSCLLKSCSAFYTLQLLLYKIVPYLKLFLRYRTETRKTGSLTSSLFIEILIKKLYVEIFFNIPVSIIRIVNNFYALPIVLDNFKNIGRWPLPVATYIICI